MQKRHSNSGACAGIISSWIALATDPMRLHQAEVKVSEEQLALTIRKVQVVRATVESKTLKLQWKEDFRTWDELQISAELASLIDIAEKKLSTAHEPSGKGKVKTAKCPL